MDYGLTFFCIICIVDYGETKIKWKTTALNESTQFNCGGIHKHVNGCIVGNFETKRRSPDHGQPSAFHCSRTVELVTIIKQVTRLSRRYRAMLHVI